MTESSEPKPTPLRAVELRRNQGAADPTAELRAALESLDGKLHAGEGFDGITLWLRRAERILTSISADDLERTRREIRDLIAQLLEINALVQNLARLKQLVS